ncbi:MAG: Ger(x)C family spore germination protein [Clostridia bacterium]|nr:Ger(x)C family spore germination protein [Clostridia bacterium]
MKRLIIIMVSLVFFSGCSNISAAELGDRLIIEAIGIDTSEDGFEITVLALNTQQSGSANSTDTPDGVAKTYSAKGKTLASAFAAIDLISGQIPLYSQARVIILGKELTQNAPMTALNYFIREYTTRDDILLAAAESTAKQIININLGNNVLASKIIHSVLQSGSFNGMTVTMPMYKFISNLLNETDAAILPIVKITKDEETKTESIGIEGSLLFAAQNSNAVLDNEQTKGLLIANDKFDSGPIEIDYKGSKVSIAVQRCSTLITLLEKPELKYTIDISLSCDIIEFNAPLHRELSMNDVEKLRMATENKIHSIVKNTIGKAVRENKCDILSLGRMLKKKSTDSYNSAIKDYNSFLATIPIEIHTTAKITRMGKEILPLN